MRWRVIAKDHHGRESVHEADTAQLRGLRDRLLADPKVASFSQPWRIDEPSDIPANCPACGWLFDGTLNDVARYECQCGLIHVRRKCRNHGCWAETFTPPKDSGCAPVPYDAEGVNDRLFRRGARKWREV